MDDVIRPKYLLIDELTYELLIRGINISRPHDEKRKILCRALDKERTSGVSLINLDKYDVSLETQIKEINNTLNSIETLIKEFEGSSNDSLYKRLRSRITHVTSRILRLITPDDQSDVKNELYANALLLDADLEESLSQSEPINTSTTFSAVTPVINVQPPIVNCNSRYTNVSDLNITFNGDPGKLPSFLEHVTDLSKSRKISDDELFNSAVELFVDDAFIWFRSVKNTVSDWTSLVSLLKSEFLPTDYEDQIWEQIKSRKQKRTEHVTIFIAHLENLFSRLSKSPLEATKIRIIMSNLLPEYISHLVLRDVSSVSELNSLCKKLEAASIHSPKSKSHVCSYDTSSGIQTTASSSTHKVQSVQFHTNPKTNTCSISNKSKINLQNQNKPTENQSPKVICWNCKQPNHAFQFCLAKEIYSVTDVDTQTLKFRIVPIVQKTLKERTHLWPTFLPF
ncbi:hypothetical protein RN001_003702 [Aquatica leii]|uniref:Retrotransposon gag domain-containing protein n=1 Tax=Aquatica leii TaxID=1421715 RepID=A0AAN7SE73_9COLE|nr:hypothetical protein RN001_003702 [Aquatica leii]